MRGGIERFAISMLWAMLAGASPALHAEEPEEQAKAALLKECGEGFEVRQTAHWLIAHKADPKWVDETAKMLERTHDLFFEQFKKAGFDPQPLGQKLVCVLIGTQDDFAKYKDAGRKLTGSPPVAEQPAPAPGRGAKPLGLGSYSERTNRIELCDIHSIPRGRPVDATRLDLENVARIAHEAAHQLSFNTGVLNHRIGYPTWLGEGLAGNFEFSDANRPFGPLTDNLSPRAARLRQLYADGKALPIQRIVTMSPLEVRQAANKGLTYAEGWGLFRFLFTERPKPLKQYLAALAERAPGQKTNAALTLAAFETAFGSVDGLEKDWQQFLKRLAVAGLTPPAPPPVDP